jgi:hypothetical protein
MEIHTQGEVKVAKKRGRPRKVAVEGAVPEKEKVGRPKKAKFEYVTYSASAPDNWELHSRIVQLEGDMFFTKIALFLLFIFLLVLSF